VLARRPDVATTRAAAAPPSVALPVPDNLGHALVRHRHACSRLEGVVRLQDARSFALLLPTAARGRSLAEALAGVPVSRALIARGAEARDVLVDALRERGAEVNVLAVYETVTDPLGEAQLAGVRAADYVTFTSSATVRLFLAVHGRARFGARGSAGRHRPGDERHAA
jgi:hypothetical protein